MVVQKLKARSRRFLFNEHGSLSTEFAIIAPMMMILALATIDTVNYINVANRVTQVSAQTADAVARRDSIADGMVVVNGNEVGQFFIAANEMGDPLTLEDTGRVIISSVANVDGTGPRIVWQRTGDYTLPVVSALGVEGDLANVPTEFELALNENAIFAEVFYEFTPLVFSAKFFGGAETVVLERMTTFRPRLAPLITLQ